MKCLRLLAAALTVVLLACTIATAAPPAGTQVALIDIGYIFKNHARYKAARDALQKRSKALQAAVNTQRNYLTEENEKLKKLQFGSPEFKNLEAKLTQQASDYQVKNELERKTLMEEEVKLYFQTYQAVQAAVESVAERHGIQLVLRYDREEMDPADPDSVRRGVLSNVVYQSRLDITELVLEMEKGTK